MTRRIWTPADTARAHRVGGLLRRTTKVGGWIFRRRRRDGGYDEPTPVPIWEGESCPIVPKEDRKTQPSLRSLEWQEIDQGNTSACAVASFCNALQFLLAKTGRAHTPMDWYKAYLAISGGSGGVEIGTVLSYAMSTGIPTVDGESVVRVTEAWDADSLDALASGLSRGCVATYGHDVHAEAAVTLIVESDGEELLDTRNSWGQGYGDNGYHQFPLSDVELGNYGAAIIREVELRPIDTAGLPDAEA